MHNYVLSPIDPDVLISNISERVTANILKKLHEMKQQPEVDTDRWFDLDELCSYLPEKPKKPTVYRLVSNNEIPFHKRSKKLFFLKSQIDNWLRDGRKKTKAELRLEEAREREEARELLNPLRRKKAGRHV